MYLVFAQQYYCLCFSLVASPCHGLSRRCLGVGAAQERNSILYPSLFLYLYLYLYLPLYKLSHFIFICISVCVWIYLSLCLCLPFCLSLSLSLSLSLYMYVYFTLALFGMPSYSFCAFKRRIGAQLSHNSDCHLTVEFWRFQMTRLWQYGLLSYSNQLFSGIVLGKNVCLQLTPFGVI